MKEFLGDVADQPQSEWLVSKRPLSHFRYITEKIRFEEEYDKDKDGFLHGEELRHWLVPDISQTAASEVEHLFSMADADRVRSKKQIQKIPYFRTENYRLMRSYKNMRCLLAPKLGLGLSLSL